MEIVEAITLSIVCTELSYLCGQNHLEIIIPVNIVLIILSVCTVLIIEFFSLLTNLNKIYVFYYSCILLR